MRTKRDKIFDNTFEDGEFELDSTLKFEVAPSYMDNRDEEDKLKKIEINEVYEYISDEMRANHSIIEIYSELCDYFNINPTKFYASLGNKFKEELIEALDKKTNILKKKNINRLF